MTDEYLDQPLRLVKMRLPSTTSLIDTPVVRFSEHNLKHEQQY